MERRLQSLERQSQHKSIPLARAIRSTNFTASATQQAFPFTAADFDTAGMWNNANPERLTVPFTGVYLVVGAAQWDGVGTGTLRSARLAVNGAGGFGAINIPAPTDSTAKSSPGMIVSLVSGDYVTLLVQHGHAGTLNMVGTLASLPVVWLGVG